MTSLKSSSLGPERRIKSSSDYLKVLQARFPESIKIYSEWFEAKALFIPGVRRVRLGLTVGKKFAVRSVDRNLIKRILRESARHHFSDFEKLSEEFDGGFDISLRLKNKMPSPVISITSLKKEIRSDADLLVNNLRGKITKRNKGCRQC